jgi:hypothetical protein
MHKKMTLRIAGAKIRHVEMGRSTFRMTCDARGGTLRARGNLNADKSVAQPRNANDRLELIERANAVTCPWLVANFE